MSDTRSLSELWRENRSKDPGTDLASVLDGCRILAQSLSPDTEVTFAGIDTANTDRQKILLSSKLLGNEHPVPGEVVDILLGLTVHEVGHVLFSERRSEYQEELAKRAGLYSYHGSRGERKIFANLVNTFEDIYVDHLMTAYPGYRDYLQRERQWAIGQFNPDSVTRPLESRCTRVDMLNAMIYLTLCGGKLPQNISQENMETLSRIARLASKMCTKKTSKQAAVLGAWKILKILPETLSDDDRGFGKPTPAPDADSGEPKPAQEQAKEDAEGEREAQEKLEEQEGLDEEAKGEDKTQEGKEDTEGEKTEQDTGNEEPENGGEEGETGESETEASEIAEGDTGGEDDEGDSGPDIDTDLDLASTLDTLVDDKTELPDDIAEEVSEAIIEKRDDLTQLLSLLAKDSHSAIIAYTPEEDAERAADARSQTSSVEEKLRRILQDYRLKRTRDYRGLMSGRVSARRLHRVAYGDQRVFQRRERPEEIDMAVCLLMDLSGSVSIHRPLIEQITCAICDAFQKEKLEFIALGYSNDIRGNNVVSIPRLYDREVGKVKLNLVKEWGNTPSYEGLAAAVAQLLRLTGNKQKILFHFTDGQPNSGNSPIIPDLLDDARARGIIDVHVCLTESDFVDERFRYLYGESTMFINNISQLPDIIDKELRSRLKI